MAPKRPGRRPRPSSKLPHAERRDRRERESEGREKKSKLAIPLPDGDKADDIGTLAFWTNEVDQAIRRRKKEMSAWRRNLDRAYRNAKDKFYGLRNEETIIVPSDFYNVEQKKSELFYETAYVQVTPEGERADTATAAPAYQHVLNFLLGEKEANVKFTVSEALTDVLCASGIGPTEIGYECARVTINVPTKRMIDVVDETTGQPIPLPPDPVTGLSPGFVQELARDEKTGEPETTKQERTVWERYYWKRFSPAKLLIPVGLQTTLYDDGPWIGREFDLDHDMIASEFGVSRGSLGDYEEDNTLAGLNDREFMRSSGRGVLIYYKARVYDRTAHPELIRKLVLVAGKRKDYVAVVHEDLEYQTFDEATGDFLSGMKGFPIHPLTIRVAGDTAYPPSDCSVARPTADEQSIGRSQMVKQRTRNVPIRGFNALGIPKDVVAKIERGDWQAMIPFPKPLTAGDFMELASASFPNENFEFDRITERSLEKIWGFPLNSDRTRTATEVSDTAETRDSRMAKDRTAVLDWYIAGVEKFSTLPQRYGEQKRLFEMEGADGVQRLQSWNKEQIQGRFAFRLRPDSSVRLNAAQQRELQLRFQNLVTNNPYFNQQEVAKMTARAFNQDPAKVTTGGPPPPPPEKPKISISIKGDDLDPTMPQYPNIIVLLQDQQLQLQPPRPGLPQIAGQGGKAGGPAPVKAATPGARVDKHDADLTDKLPGPGPV